MVKKVLLSDTHSKEAQMTEFAGFYMPLFYSSILDEHMAVREKVGIFDVSHMGRALIEGVDATKFVNYLTANDVNRLVDRKSHYSLLLNENGGIVDDILVYRLTQSKIMIVYNAGNREKDLQWITSHADDFNVSIEDISDRTVMIAIQGPLSTKVVGKIYRGATDLKRFYITHFFFKDIEGWISRTGYTGEDGFEIIAYVNDTNSIVNFWNGLKRNVISVGGLPCGLGARDSLRLEAGYCLYGNDIDETTNPYEANLSWVVKMDQGDFIGKQALLELKDNITRLRIGLVMNDRSIPRKDYSIYDCDNKNLLGQVTSGGFSPILKKGIGMGYVNIKYAVDGQEICIDVRGKIRNATIRNFPLYDTDRFGFRRKE